MKGIGIGLVGPGFIPAHYAYTRRIERGFDSTVDNP
jgi:hypothetical protein